MPIRPAISADPPRIGAIGVFHYLLNFYPIIRSIGFYVAALAELDEVAQ